MNTNREREFFVSDQVPAATRRERRKQEYRQRILDAAIEVFESIGCEAATLESICEAADVSRPTFYKYFDGKPALIRALAEQLWLNVAQQFDSEFDHTNETIDDYLAHFFTIVRLEFSKYSRLERELIRYSMTQSTGDDHSINLLKTLTQMFSGAYLKAAQKGQLNLAYPVDFMAEMTMASINTVMMSWAMDEQYPLAERLDQLASYLPDTLRIAKK
ncbi:putative HTH-type transcriptional regulator TtgW [BD1-7 clade bacterium]|uniref:Putative HTH-type transcriptional regulator TtgW n=1 Tax=BD1-7 clade bacterium TaxID=2029982 RepID=A0A5S9QUZ4_9GAMM|nr:putative HTH-type transcriptional regulator TtgW [BD1-7 clade bacterium]